MVRGKTEFTSSEYAKLIELVEELQRVDPSKQKGIRNKLRALGLYWSEVGSGKAYTRENVEELFKTGSLQIARENGNTPATTAVEDNRPYTENSTTASRVFISYKRKNKDLVFPIKEKIERAIGENCWIDLDGIESSAQFVKVIIKAIDRCEVFLFMHSSLHANISDIEKDWTIRELQYAEEENKRIVFINLDRSKLGKWFKFMFGQKQQIDALDPEAIERLISDLRSWLAIPEIEESELSEGLPIIQKPEIKGSNNLETLKNSNTKTTHKVGDKHPTRPWVWTEYKPGKFDWRVDKSFSPQKTEDSGETIHKNIYGESKSPKENNIQYSIINRHDNNLYYEIDASKINEYKQNAKGFDPLARVKLGLCYLYGEGVKQNVNMAVTWFKNAAELGDNFSRCWLGNHFESNGQYEKAVKYYRLAAKSKYPEALFRLGLLYIGGKGCVASNEKSLQFIREASSLNYKPAIDYLDQNLKILMQPDVVPEIKQVYLENKYDKNKITLDLIISNFNKTDRVTIRIFNGEQEIFKRQTSLSYQGNENHYSLNKHQSIKAKDLKSGLNSKNGEYNLKMIVKPVRKGSKIYEKCFTVKCKFNRLFAKNLLEIINK